MAIEFPVLWGKNKDGKDGFVVSHVKQIYYDWKSKKMLSDKLDDMDEIITANADAIAERLVTNDALATALANYVTKSMMSGQQVNDANMVPTSALAYAMQQAITKNAGDISTLNSDSMMSRGILSGAFDFNDYLTTGFYYIGNFDGAQNDPPFTTSAGILIVYAIGSAFTIQTCVCRGGIAMRYRAHGGNFLNWTQY